MEPPPDIDREKELYFDGWPEPERPDPGPPRVRGEHLEGGALDGRHAPSLELEDVRRGERQGGRDEGLGLKAAVQVRRRGVSVISRGPGRAVLRRVWGRNPEWVPRSQRVAAVDRLESEVRVGLGGGVGPRLQELRCADAVAQAVADGGAQDHSPASEICDLTMRAFRTNA